MSQSELEFHRKIAKRCFNETWDYLDKKNRDANDDQRMLHSAHASRYHWASVEAPKNEQMRSLAVGDWQISRVYAALKQSELALHFAKSALEIMQKNNLTDILHTGFEGMARAYAIANDNKSAGAYVGKAREQLNKASALNVEDKQIYLDQIRETEELIGK